MDTIELEKSQIMGSKVSYEKNERLRYHKTLVSRILESCFYA